LWSGDRSERIEIRSERRQPLARDADRTPDREADLTRETPHDQRGARAHVAPEDPSREHRDPRDIVTPHAFRIAPDLLGTPLAGPFRRAAAMLVDLAAVGILAGVLRSLGGILFAAMFAWIFWRTAGNRSGDHVMSRFARRALLGMAALMAFVALVQGWEALTGGDRGPGRRGGPRVVSVGRDSDAVTTLRSLGLGDVASSVGDALVLRDETSSPDRARTAAIHLADRLGRAGASRQEIREALGDILSERGDSTVRRSVVDAAMAHVDSANQERFSSGDSAVLALAEALRSGDSAAARGGRQQVADVLAGDRIRRLRSQVEELQGQLSDARKSPGIVSFLKTLANDLGFGVGWLGFYFTVLPVFWKGRTLGKRLTGTRVVRLSGEKIGWWSSFSRFGGYAAGLATGLLGFLQVLWDPNRQGIQDRIAGTVVVRERGGRR